MMVTGQLARTLAMKHAGKNFSHQVATRREPGHELVTRGIYAYVLRPSLPPSPPPITIDEGY